MCNANAGLQITALGNPKLLERVAAGLTAIRNLFSQFDQDMNNVITREEFAKVTLMPIVRTARCIALHRLHVQHQLCLQ